MTQSATPALSIQSCLQNGNVMGALKHAELWIIQDRENADAWFWRGTVQAQGRLEEEAIKSWQQALTLMPDHRGTAHNLTLALMKAGRFEEAKGHLLELEKRLPKDGQIQAWLGHALSALYDQEAALYAYKNALRISGRDPQLLKLAAFCARDLGRAKEALELLNQAIEMQPSDPVLRFERGCLNLMLGDYQAGFKEYEYRWQRDSMEMPDLSMPQWMGESLAGKHILIHDEQGMGDSIMFARFLLPLLTQGAKVSYWVRPHLKRLLSSLSAEISVITEADVSADYHCPVMSLPYCLGIKDGAELLGSSPFLFPEDELITQWQEKLKVAGDKKKVGLIWQGDPSSQAERGRSQSFAAYLSHLKPDHHYFILQCRHGREELAGLILPENVTDLGDILDLGPDAFIDTAAVMSLLDLIITTDTGPAHLAGSLGCKIHLILKEIPEWRWGLKGETTPWYKNMKLIRGDISQAFNV